MKTANKIYFITILFVFVNIIGYSQNTFKLVYNGGGETSLDNYLIKQDSLNYRIFNLFGMHSIDTNGNLYPIIKRYNYISLDCSAIINNTVFSFCNTLLNKSCIVKGNLSLDTIIWIRKYKSNRDTLSCYSMGASWNNSLLYSGNFYAEFGEMDTSGHIIRSFKDSTLSGSAKFTYLLDSSTYLVGINSTFGAIILEIDTSGIILNQKRIIGNSSLFTSSVQGNNKEVNIIGIENKDSVSNIFIFNYSKGGNINWSKEIKLESTYCCGYSPAINLCNNGDLILTATSGLLTDPNLELIKLNSNGDSLWSISHGGNSSIETGIASIETNDHGYLVIGSSNTKQLGNYQDYIPLVIKTDSLGQTSTHCQESYFPFSINSLIIQDSLVNLSFYSIYYQDILDTTSIISLNNILSSDGCILSSLPEVSSKSIFKNFIIYPNPSKSFITVKSENTNLFITQIDVIDNLGVTVLTIPFTKKKSVDVNISYLVKGNYHVKIQSGNLQETYGFIKE